MTQQGVIVNKQISNEVKKLEAKHRLKSARKETFQKFLTWILLIITGTILDIGIFLSTGSPFWGMIMFFLPFIVYGVFKKFTR